MENKAGYLGKIIISKKWLSSIVIAMGSLSFGMGVLSIYGWHIGDLGIIQFRPGLIPIPYNATLAFMVNGLAFILLAMGLKKIPRYVGVATFLFGWLVLLQFLFGFDFGVEHPLFIPDVSGDMAVASKIPMGGAISFCLVGVALILMTFYERLKHPFLILGVISSLLLARSVMVLFHYLMGVPMPFMWFHSMAIPGAISFLCLGIGTLAYIYKEKPPHVHSHHWMPIMSVIAAFSVTFSFWQVQVTKDQARISQLVYLNGFNISRQIALGMEARIQALKSMGRTWSMRGYPTEIQWAAESQAVLNDFMGFQSLGWVDAAHVLRKLKVNEGSESLLLVNQQVSGPLLTVLDSLDAEKGIVLSGPERFFTTELEFVVCVPVMYGEKYNGTVVGSFNKKKLFSAIMSQQVSNDFSIHIDFENKNIYEINTLRNPADMVWVDPIPIHVQGATWKLLIAPTSQFFKKNRSYLAEATLFTGVLLSLLLGLIIYLWQSMRHRARKLQESNIQLGEEINLRKAAETSFMEQSSRLRSILDAMGDGVVVADKDGKIVLINPAARKIMRVDASNDAPEQWKFLMDVFHTDQTTRYFPREYPLFRALQGESVDSAEMFLVFKETKEEVFVSATTRPIYGASGEVQGAVSVFRDISELKRSEEILRQSQEDLAKLASIVESSDDAIIGTSLDGTIASWNEGAEKIFGYSENEMIGKSVSVLIPIGNREELATVLSQIKNKVHLSHFETVRIHKDGRSIPVSLATSPINNDKGEVLGMSVVARDISRRIEAERALRESQELFHTFMNNSPAVAFMKDEEGRYVYVNQTFEKTHEQKLSDLRGKTDFDWLPDHIAAEVRKNDQTTLDSNKAFEVVERVPLVDGSTKDWLAFKFLVKADSGKRFIGGVAVDISERRKAEEAIRRANAELELRVLERTKELDAAIQSMHAEIILRKRIEKELAKRAEELAMSNQELEQFALVASHDLQEPLRKISSYGELLAQRYQGQLDEKADKFIGYMIDGVHRMQNLIKGLLAYARIGKANVLFREVDLIEVARQAVIDLEALIQEKNAHVIYENLPVVWANPAQMGQLFQNLISNGLKFGREEPPRINISASQRENEWIIAVADNGIGIEPQHMDRIFQIFQRLHSQKEFPGTGIGLAVCKKILERHGGRIWGQSKVGEGTTFFVSLPVNVESSASAPVIPLG